MYDCETFIIRHKKENIKKCSLRGLEGRKDFLFKQFPLSEPLIFENTYLLSFEGPILSEADRDCSILLLDGTWRYTEKMWNALPQLHLLPQRSLPSHFRTAYPRRQDDCKEPSRGLASIEALAVAYFLLGREWLTLLNHYHWKEHFLKLNPKLLSSSTVESIKLKSSGALNM